MTKTRKQPKLKYIGTQAVNQKPIGRMTDGSGIVRGINGQLRPGVRRHTPNGYAETYSYGTADEHKPKRTHRLGMRLSEVEWNAIAEFQARSNSEISRSRWVFEAIMEYMPANPPIRTTSRNYLRLCDDRNKTILYRKGLQKVDPGHIHMLDYDPVQRTRTSRVLYHGAIYVTEKDMLTIKNFCYNHKISQAALIHLATVEYLCNHFHELVVPTWHDHQILDKWHESRTIRKNMRTLRLSKKNGKQIKPERWKDPFDLA